MSTPKRSEYMLLFRSTDWHKGLSPEEIQQVVNRMKAWFDRLTAEGKAKAGKPLFHEGKIVSQKGDRLVVDGPFAESKEAIGGFFLLEVGSLDDATEIAKDFPALEYGATIEVRPVAPECMVGETGSAEKCAGSSLARERIALRLQSWAAHGFTPAVNRKGALSSRKASE